MLTILMPRYFSLRVILAMMCSLKMASVGNPLEDRAVPGVCSDSYSGSDAATVPEAQKHGNNPPIRIMYMNGPVQSRS